MKVDAPEGCCLVEKLQTVGGEDLCDGIRVLPLPWKVESGHHTGVLIKARAFRQSPQRALNGAHSRIKLQVRYTLLVNADQREKASVPSTF
ncbi:hypothetical protein [Granulicella sp. dw_53]|uniref:hypothetical protein n=1 Tax=Granulicella sp. dw_53 TaxID=2719792 RepID=UPI0031F5F96E